MDSNNIPNSENFFDDLDETFNKLFELPSLKISLDLEDEKSECSIFDDANKFHLPWEYRNDDNQEVKLGLVSESSVYASLMDVEKKVKIGRKRRVELDLEEIQKHFHLPITKAAKEMKIGLTVLKKRCRELNIMRWPHRKIKSLKSLIHSVKEMGLNDEIQMLEEHKRLVEEMPDQQLSIRTLKLRQQCFKAKYNKKRFRSE